MTKNQARRALNCANDNQLAIQFQISRQAVEAWNPRKIPELRALQITTGAVKARG